MVQQITPIRNYNRTWREIEDMLQAAIEEQTLWRMHFERATKQKHAQARKDAARNYKALEGVIKTLKWVLGEGGIDHPLE